MKLMAAEDFERFSKMVAEAVSGRDFVLCDEVAFYETYLNTFAPRRDEVCSCWLP